MHGSLETGLIASSLLDFSQPQTNSKKLWKHKSHFIVLLDFYVIFFTEKNQKRLQKAFVDS